MSSSDKESYIFAGNSSTLDWTTYLKVRPEYTKSSFYDLIYEYHKSHSGSFNVAYDIGCGPGQVTSTLASRFNHVHGSDPNDYIINVARQTWEGTKNVTFEACAAEKLTDGQEEKQDRLGSVDLITVAEAIPLMDTKSSMAAFADLLKPGGTLAIWFYGGPIFHSPGADDDDSPEVQELQKVFRLITDYSFDQFRPFDEHWRQAWEKISSWLDNIAFDPRHFRNVRRIKWNSDRPLVFLDSREDSGDYVNGGDYKSSSSSRITPDETVEDRGKDKAFWAKENVDFEWAKGFIDAQMPRTKDYITEEVSVLYEQLEALMRGKTWNVRWPVVLLLATRT